MTTRNEIKPELWFAVNSAVQESIGMTPAELHLGRKLQGPMDKWTNRISLPIYLPMMLSIILSNFNQRPRSAAKKLRKDNFGTTIKTDRRPPFKEKCVAKEFPPVQCTTSLQCKTCSKMEGSLSYNKAAGTTKLSSAIGVHRGRCSCE